MTEATAKHLPEQLRSGWQTKRPLAAPLPQRPSVTKIMTECKPNLSLSGVLVYITGGQRPPGAES